MCATKKIVLASVCIYKLNEMRRHIKFDFVWCKWIYHTAMWLLSVVTVVAIWRFLALSPSSPILLCAADLVCRIRHDCRDRLYRYICRLSFWFVHHSASPAASFLFLFLRSAAIDKQQLDTIIRVFNCGCWSYIVTLLQLLHDWLQRTFIESGGKNQLSIYCMIRNLLPVDHACVKLKSIRHS